MATGKSSYFDLDCTSSGFKIRVNWSETYDASTNSSVVTVSSVQFKSTSWYGFTYYPDGLVKINGTTVITMNSNLGSHNCRAGSLDTWSTIKISGGATATGSTTVVHGDDGKKSVSIEVAGNRFGRCYFYCAGDESKGGSGWGCTGSKTVALTDIPVYSLTISAGTGSSIAVSRTSSGYASTGSISSGAKLYYGDKLKITFTPSTNYRLLTTKVNNANFTSGNTHTVASNVSVTSTAQVLASSVGATDANIGSSSTITVTKYSTSYYHSLQYSFGNLSGYITSSGGVSTTESKFSGTSVAFSVPTTFYAQIPGSKTGTCTITCRTYSSSTSTTVLGNATTCAFTVTATGSPTVSGTVVDTNTITVALTGDSSKLIRYMSTAVATISATAKNSASIASKLINNAAPNTSNQRTFTGVSTTSFVFKATDSRGYSSSATVEPTMVAYNKLTLNPEISRPQATGSEMTLSMSGNYYRGSFGVYSNTLTISYRYREATQAAFGSWTTIPSSSYTISSSSYSGSSISLGKNFDYQKSYIFQIKAVDGTSAYPLTSVTKEVSVQRGIPVFDWGENDFDFHVPVKISDEGTLTIGSTTITEAQLKSLLALIS